MSTLIEKLPENLRPPTECPICGTSLVLEFAWPKCPNFSCPIRIYGRLQKFVNVLDIKGAGEETLKGLALSGVCVKAADLFEVTQSQFIDLDRKGIKHYAKFRIGIEACRKMSVPKFFASLDLEGEGTWEAIVKVPGLDTVEEILTAVSRRDYRLFEQAMRVSYERAEEMCATINFRLGEVLALLKEVEILKAGSNLKGKTIVITGTLSVPRTQLVTKIKAQGGSVGSGVSVKTDYLVCSDPDGSSSKTVKARKLNIPMISEADLLVILGE